MFVLLVRAPGARAGGNQGAAAYLTWNAADKNATDLSDPGASNSLYIVLERPDGLAFKGGELDLTWNPPGDADGNCIAHTATVFRASTGADCSFLNRGLIVPLTTADEPGHLHIAWASDALVTGCTSGAIIELHFAFDGCTDPSACFTLNSLAILDAQNVCERATPYGWKATVRGGSGMCTTLDQPPVLNPIGTQSGIEGHIISFSVVASDPDWDPLTYTAGPLPAGATYADHVFEWTPATGQAGDYDVVFYATDPFGKADSEHVGISVAGGPCATDSPPSFGTAPDVHGIEGARLEFSMTANDAEGGPITYAATDLPHGASVTGYGSFEWTPDFGQAGTYAITFSATDACGLSGTQTVIVKIATGVPPATNAHAQAWLTWNPSDETASDLADVGAVTSLYVYVERSAALDFAGGAIDLAWSGSQCPARIGAVYRGGEDCTYLNRGTTVPIVDADEPGHFRVTWTNDVASTQCTAGAILELQFDFDGCTQTAGCFTLRQVSLLDGHGAPTCAVVAGAHATVLGGSASCPSPLTTPSFTPIPDAVVDAGTSTTFFVSAVDAACDSVTYSMESLPTGARFVGNTFSWTPGYHVAGEFHTQFIAQAASGAADSQWVTITVRPHHFVRYVDAAHGSRMNDGFTWATATSSIQTAANACVPYLDSVFVAEGTYAEDLRPPTGAVIMGGYPSGGGDRDVSAHETILTPDPATTFGQLSALLIVGGNSVVVDGFTLRGVNSDVASVVRVQGANVTLRQLHLTGNAITSSRASFVTGDDPYPVILDIDRYSAHTFVDHCLIEGNVVPDVQQTVMIGVQGTASVTFDHCDVVYGSHSLYGSVVFLGSRTAMTNCIVWSTATQPAGFRPLEFRSDVPASITYCDVIGGADGAGNIDADPLFCDASSGRYGLQETSPCVGAGTSGETIGAFDAGCTEASGGGPGGQTGGGSPGGSPGGGSGGGAPLRTALTSVGPTVTMHDVSVRFSLAAPVRVVVELFDVTGHRAAVLCDEPCAEGTYTRHFDLRSAGRGVRAGAYILRFQAGEMMDTRRIVVLQ